MGYFETHGKTEFLAGEQYGLTDEQKKVSANTHFFLRNCSIQSFS